MNYYEHHIGDYDQATAHLTACEDGIYSRMIRWYMAKEGPLPADVKAIQRRVRATTKDERAAVQAVLDEFFDLREDGYHQHRCDEEIARFQDKQAKAKRSAEARWSGQRSQSDGNASASASASPNAMRTQSEGNAPRARPQTPDTRHQSPDTTTQTQSLSGTETGGEPIHRAPSVAPARAVDEPQAEAPEPGAAARSMPVETAMRLRKLGFRVTGSHPDLLAADTEGVTVDEIVAMAELYPTKPAAYVIAAARSQHAEGPKARTGTARGSGARQTDLEARNRKIAAEWAAQAEDDTHASR